MDELFFINSAEPIKPEDVTNLQQKYSLSFSKDYIELILRYNGGRPSRTLYESDNESLIFSELFPIKNASYTIENAILKFKIDDKIIPDYLIPIGADPADNLICLSQDAKNYGSIYVWVHDSGKSLRYISSSLHEVLNNLKEFEW